MIPFDRQSGQSSRIQEPQVELAFEAPEKKASPGDTVRFPFLVSNASDHARDCQYLLRADESFKHSWTVIVSAAVGPGEQAHGELEIRVPLKGDVRPGQYQLCLLATPTDSSPVAAAQCLLTIMEAKPCVWFPSLPKFEPQADGSVTATCSLGNCGNLDLKVSCEIRHKEGWKFEIDSPELTLRSGGGPVEAKLTLRPPSGKSARPGDEVTLDITWQGQTLHANRKGHIETKFGPPPLTDRTPLIVVGAAIVAGLIGLGAWLAARPDTQLAPTPGVLAGKPTPLNFQEHRIGDRSPALTFTATNKGNERLEIGDAQIRGASQEDFKIEANECSGATLATKRSCTINISFAPNEIGGRSANLTINRRRGGSLLTGALVGTGTDGLLATDFTQIGFTNQTVGTRSAPRRLTVTNRGTALTRIERVALAGSSPGDFAVGSGGCQGTTLAPDQGCAIEVIFTPTAKGGRSASLIIDGSESGKRATVALSGEATEAGPQSPGVTLDVVRLDFGNQRVKTDSSLKTVHVQNKGSRPVKVDRVALEGINRHDFAVETNRCADTSIVPHHSCSLELTFTPTATGGRSAILSVKHTGSSEQLTLALAGTGTAPLITMSPSRLDFGQQSVGITSASQAVTVTNEGSASATFQRITIDGANPKDFSRGPGRCKTLAPGASCTLGMSFAPSGEGGRSANLTFGSKDAEPVTVALVGTGLLEADLAVEPPVWQNESQGNGDGDNGDRGINGGTGIDGDNGYRGDDGFQDNGNIKVTNIGPSGATGVVITLTGSFSQVRSSQGSCSAETEGPFTCNLGNLASRQTATITFRLDDCDNGMAEVEGSELDPNYDNNEISFVAPSCGPSSDSPGGSGRDG